MCTRHAIRIKSLKLNSNEKLLTDDSFSAENTIVKTKSKVSLEEVHVKFPETKEMLVDDNDGAVKFADSFACLGAIISLLLCDDAGTVEIIPKESAHVGVLRIA